jgi:hypothetical protein
MEDDRTVYTMYLNTYDSFPTLFNNASKVDVSWLVNWDQFFDYENTKYNKCKVRVQLVSLGSASVTQADFQGVLVSNFASRYNGNIIRSTPLGIINISTTPTAGTNIFSVDTLQTLGQNISVPYGANQLNLQLYKTGYGAVGSASNVLLGVDTVNYQVILQFELYDEKDM